MSFLCKDVEPSEADLFLATQVGGSMMEHVHGEAFIDHRALARLMRHCFHQGWEACKLTAREREDGGAKGGRPPKGRTKITVEGYKCSPSG